MVLLASLKLPMRTPAPDFSLIGIDDQKHSLAEYSKAKVLVVVFTCNHCPYAHAVWPRLVALQEKYKDQSVQFVAINSNYNPDYPEDSFEKMKEYALKFKVNFPYLQDMTQDIARSFKAQCTPDIYVFGQDRKLAYHGRVDDNWKEPEKVTRHELDDAIVLLLQGKVLSEEQHPSMGCSIKYRES